MKRLISSFNSIYDRTTSHDVPIRNIAIGLGNLVDEGHINIDMFTDEGALMREHSLLSAIVSIKDKYGKNAIVNGSAFEENSTARARNLMVGGHNGE